MASTSGRVDHGTRPGTKERLWRTNDRKAQKEGKHATVFDTNGEQYTGEWSDNQRHGKGVVVYKNGDKYEGDWHGGVRHGQGTLWVLRDGCHTVRYSGDWADDLPDGQGKFLDESGDSYEGGWRDGLREGLGCAAYGPRPGGGGGGGGGEEEEGVYEGQWEADVRHGHGTMAYANGDVFEGEWRGDAKHGPGTFFYNTRGRRYDGVWDRGTPKAGSYSELSPAPPGSAGSLPSVELAAPEGVVAEGAAAASEAAEAAGAGAIAP
ncbi:MAG: hypothetical protein J3K34DRAFT_524609 [Monoraphidium minutum]|nr:MAG: hypothetical protein J3K34DRAFT_524609 [Monoraphidium minutum]